MIPSYTQFVRYNKELFVPDERRDILGVFKNSKTKKVIKGDNFSCINIKNDAEKSYRIALEYFNHTTEKGDAKRIFVSAKWKAETPTKKK